MATDANGARAGATTACRMPKWRSQTAAKGFAASAAICSGGLDSAAARSRPCSADFSGPPTSGRKRRARGRNDGSHYIGRRICYILSFSSWHYLLFHVLLTCLALTQLFCVASTEYIILFSRNSNQHLASIVFCAVLVTVHQVPPYLPTVVASLSLCFAVWKILSTKSAHIGQIKEDGVLLLHTMDWTENCTQ